MIVKCLVAIFVVCAVSAFGQAQQRSNQNGSKPTKADAQRVVEMIRGNEVKLQQYCELANIEDELEKAEKREDMKKVQEFFYKALELAQKLGLEYMALIVGLERMDQSSKEFEEIGLMLLALDKLCAKK